MNKWSLMIQKNLTIPSYLMVQREFRLEVGTLIIQKSKVIPPSSMVLLKPSPRSSFDAKA